MFAPWRAPRTAPSTAALSLPPATAALHTAAACCMYMLVGGGALAACCGSAAQQAFKLRPVPVPTFFASPSPASITSSPASSTSKTSGALGVFTGAADGSGGGGSSFLQPEYAAIPSG